MKSSLVFNGPVEIGLRALMLLTEAFPRSLDLQRLVVLDYLLVHSGDVEGGPPSLHAPSPLRAGEVSIRRGLIEDSLHLLATKDLIEQVVDAEGLRYRPRELATTFLDALCSPYALALRDRASWAVGVAAALSDEEANRLLEESTGRWRTEFVVEQFAEDL